MITKGNKRIQLISESDFEDFIKKVELSYKDLWGILTDFKKLKVTELFYSFQFKLADTLSEVGGLNLTLAQSRKGYEERFRIDLGSRRWNRQRIRKIKKYKEILGILESIGRSLGDSYVLFFFRDQEHLLEKHLSVRPVEPAYGTLGRKGEIAFLKKYKYGKSFVLYNDLTNILRLGDFTVVSTKTLKVVGTCEVKSRPVNINELNITASFLLTDESILPQNVNLEAEEVNSAFPLDIPIENHLKRQMKKITDLHKPNTPIDKTVDIKYEKINSFHTKKTGVNLWQIDDGLILIQIPMYRSFMDLNRKIYDKSALKGHNKIIDFVKKNLVLKGSNYNQLHIGALLYNGKKNKVHPVLGLYSHFWLSLEIDFLENLYFLRNTYITVFNPAYMIKMLEEKGFEVIVKRKKISLKKREGKYVGEVNDLSYFIGLHVNSLIPISTILEMIYSITDIANISKSKNSRTQVNLNVKLHQYFNS